MLSAIAVDDGYGEVHDHPIEIAAPGVLFNDSAFEATAVLDQGPSHAELFQFNADGGFTYVPQSNWFGFDSFTYYAVDANTGRSEEPATVSIEITDAQPYSPFTITPQVRGANDPTNEEIELSMFLGDADADPLTFSVSGNTNAALFDSIVVNPVTGTAVLDYALGAVGEAYVTFRATDPCNLYAEVTYHVTAIYVDLRIADGQNGNTLSEEEEGGENASGAFTVANMNDSDGDGVVDFADDEVRPKRTALTDPAPVGADQILVADASGFHVGDWIIIGGPEWERRIIAGIGDPTVDGTPIILDAPLDNEHAEGYGVYHSGHDEVDLMKMTVMKPNPVVAGAVMTLQSNHGGLNIWRNPWKGDPAADLILTAGDPPLQIEDSWFGEADRFELWVELKEASASLKDYSLRLEYMGVEDIVEMTGIWARITDLVHDDGDVFWVDADNPVAGQAASAGGVGLRPIQNNLIAANIIGFQFTISPPGIGFQPRVAFDITRNKESKKWERASSNDNWPPPVILSKWPQDMEEANDDKSDETDETARPNERDRMYSMDSPLIFLDPNSFQVIYKGNYNEFLRIAVGTIGGTQQTAEGDGQKGSRASEYVQWHARHELVNENGTWRRTTGDMVETESNDIGTGHIAVQRLVPMAAGGNADFGMTDLGVPVAMTFSIANDGPDSLDLGTMDSLPSGWTLAGPPPEPTVPPGGNTTFTIQLTADEPGSYNATVSFTPTGFPLQGDGFSFNIAGVVRETAVIDNDAEEARYSVSGDFAAHPASTTGMHHGDYDYAASTSFLAPLGEAVWTFNVSPGQYEVAATWVPDTTFWAANATYVMDGGVPVSAAVDQRVAPGDFTFDESSWEDLATVYVMGDTLVVRLSNDTGPGFYIADAIRIKKVGGLPAGPEVQVIADGRDIADGAGTVSFGELRLGEAIDKTFTVANVGQQTLSLTGGNPTAITLPTGYSLVSGLSQTTLAPGATATFVVRFNPALPGTYDGEISFATDDSDENPFNLTVTGTRLAIDIIDDRDPSQPPTGYTDGPLGHWGTLAGAGAEADFRYGLNYDGTEAATWTFNVTPGQYRVSATWPFGASGYDDASPFTVFDGAAISGGLVRGGRNLNQQVSPNDRFAFDLWWEDIDVVNITGTTLTVQLRADDRQQFVVADSILIERLGDTPAGPEVVVVTDNDRNANAGTIGYETTQLNDSVDRTFTITNSGTSALTVNAGSFTVPDGYALVSGPSLTTINPGETSTFVVRLTAAYEGIEAGAITFTTNDADESTVSIDITGEVLTYRIIDDQDTDAGYSVSGPMLSGPNGLAYQGDVSYVHSSEAATVATWSFSGLTPGYYAVALTWFDADGSSLYSNATPVTVMDGTQTEGTFLVNQQDGPSSLTPYLYIDDTWWYTVLGFAEITSTTVTVTMTNVGANGFILADGVLLYRLTI